MGGSHRETHFGLVGIASIFNRGCTKPRLCRTETNCLRSHEIPSWSGSNQWSGPELFCIHATIYTQSPQNSDNHHIISTVVWRHIAPPTRAPTAVPQSLWPPFHSTLQPQQSSLRTRPVLQFLLLPEGKSSGLSNLPKGFDPASGTFHSPEGCLYFFCFIFNEYIYLLEARCTNFAHRKGP